MVKQEQEGSLDVVALPWQDQPGGMGGYIDHKLGHRAAGANASLNLGQVVDQERQRSIGLLHQAIIMATWSAGRR
jgi:hypothetical protein